MINGKFLKIFEQYKWKDLGNQKMKGMLSFQLGNLRANFYTTTETLTIQNTEKMFDKGLSFKKVDNEDFLKNILLFVIQD